MKTSRGHDSLRCAHLEIRQMERLPNRECPRCGRMNMNIYFSNDEDEKLGAWCESCDLRAYYNGNELVSLN